jgi:hypothetical protein
MALYRAIPQGGVPPSKWKIVHYANIGSSELFVHRFGELPKLLDASRIFDPHRSKGKAAMWDVLTDGFMPAFEHLRNIRAHSSEPTPELNRKQAYEDFMRTLWHAYKDLMPKAARELGFEVGFLFQQDQQFEKGLRKLLGKHSALRIDLGEFLREQRDGWQGTLQRIRNDYLEHRKLEWTDVSQFYSVWYAEAFFDAAWNAATDIFAVLIASNFPPMIGIAEIPEAQRDPNRPDKFAFVFKQALTPK